jgi:hypothetical protein
MPDWADVQGMYEVDTNDTPGRNSIYPLEQQTASFLSVTVPGVPRFMKLRGGLRWFWPKRKYRLLVLQTLAMRMDKIPRVWESVAGWNSTAELDIRVYLKPSRFQRERVYKAMMAGYVRPSIKISLDVVIATVIKAITGEPLNIIRKRTDIAGVNASVRYGAHDCLVIRIEKSKQNYNIHLN